jgi:hypothetical protein
MLTSTALLERHHFDCSNLHYGTAGEIIEAANDSPVTPGSGEGKDQVNEDDMVSDSGSSNQEAGCDANIVFSGGNTSTGGHGGADGPPRLLHDDGSVM